MGMRVPAVNFTKGEVSPEVEARFDLDVYKAGLRKASNVIIRRTGGVRKRPGSRLVSPAMGTTERLVPFQFSDSQAYCLEFAQGLMRPLALGGIVLETGLKVTAITNEAKAKVTCAYHGYSVGDPVWFDSILGMTEINSRFLQVTSVVDANNFHVNFNSTYAGVFTGDTGGQVNSKPPTPPPTTAPPPPTPTPSPTPPPVTTGGSVGGGGSGTGDTGGGASGGVGSIGGSGGLGQDQF